jgi:hypothetical protein
MTWQLLLTLVGAAAGLVSGGWLCFPTAAANPHALAWVAEPPYKSVEGVTQLAIAQSAQYWVGGFFLAAAFLLQVVAALTPASSLALTELTVALWRSLAVLAGCLLIFAGLRVWLYRLRKRAMHTQLERAAAYLSANRRLTPLP